MVNTRWVIIVQTLYIDVYFFINFTVDILALYFSSAFAKIFTTVPRLLLGGAIGGAYSVIGILLVENSFLMYPLSILFIVLMVSVTAKGAGIYRKIKYCIAFLLFQILLGGLVYYGYCALDKLPIAEKINGFGEENRNLLILAVLVLFSIGVLKLMMSLFGNTRSERNVKITLKYRGRESELDALVDSGNLACDPIDKTPVMLISSRSADKLLGEDAELITTPEHADYGLKKRLRIIPVNFGSCNKVLYGVKPDEAYVHTGKKQIKISLVIAIDAEGRDYGGYTALIPLSALEDVFHGNI